MSSVTWFDSRSASTRASVWNLLTAAFREPNEELHPPGTPVDVGLKRSLPQQPCGLNGTSVSALCLWFSPHASLHSLEFEHAAMSKIFNIKEKCVSVINIFIFAFFCGLFLLQFLRKHLYYICWAFTIPLVMGRGGVKDLAFLLKSGIHMQQKSDPNHIFCFFPNDVYHESRVTALLNTLSLQGASLL